MGTHGDSGWSFSFENNPLWRLKLRLQHTGWLQYALPFLWALISLIVATIEYFAFGSSSRIGISMAFVFAGLGIFDIATCNYDIRPLESIPPRKDNLTNIQTMLQERRSCRSFQTRKLTLSHRTELLDVAQVCLDQKLFDKPIRLEWIEKPIKVWPAVNCQEFFVAIAPKVYSREAILDLGRCLEQTVLHATRMGLGTLWVGPGADHESIIEALGKQGFDADRDHIICVCAMGYPSRFAPTMIRLMGEITHMKRLALDKLVFQDKQCQKALQLQEPDAFPLFQELRPAFEAVRWAPSSYNAQTTRCSAAVVEKDGTKHLQRIDFYRSMPSKFYATIALGIWMTHWEEACKELGFHGRFEIDKARIQGDGLAEEPPIYGISWVFDEPRAISES